MEIKLIMNHSNIDKSFYQEKLNQLLVIIIQAHGNIQRKIFVLRYSKFVFKSCFLIKINCQFLKSLSENCLAKLFFVGNKIGRDPQSLIFLIEVRYEKLIKVHLIQLMVPWVHKLWRIEIPRCISCT